jgi:uncharacterized protein
LYFYTFINQIFIPGMDVTHNVVGWFEIPVTDMDRAVRFYETVFGFTLHRQVLGTLEMAWFPGVQGSMGASGSLVRNEKHYTPSPDGVLVYFTAFSGDVAIELGRVAAAGGVVLMARTQISEEIGYMGLFTDPDGNRIAVHSRK